MDIKDWLRNTFATQESSEGSDSLLYPGKVETSATIVRRRRDCINPRDSDLSTCRDAHYDRLEPGWSRTRDEDALSLSSRREKHDFGITALDDIFEKRGRHKTKPNKYEPISHETKSSSKRNPKCHQRTERKKKKEPKLGKVPVERFRAQNVVGSRLTLRQPHNVGLFKRGRASLPQAGRGLPDLVFSDMRFLSKRAQHLPDDTGYGGSAELGPQQKPPTRTLSKDMAAFYPCVVDMEGLEAATLKARAPLLTRDAMMLGRQSIVDGRLDTGRESAKMQANLEKPNSPDELFCCFNNVEIGQLGKDLASADGARSESRRDVSSPGTRARSSCAANPAKRSVTDGRARSTTAEAQRSAVSAGKRRKGAILEETNPFPTSTNNRKNDSGSPLARLLQLCNHALELSRDQCEADEQDGLPMSSHCSLKSEMRIARRGLTELTSYDHGQGGVESLSGEFIERHLGTCSRNSAADHDHNHDPLSTMPSTKARTWSDRLLADGYGEGSSTECGCCEEDAAVQVKTNGWCDNLREQQAEDSNYISVADFWRPNKLY